MKKIICFDFDDVIINTNIVKKIGRYFKNRFEEKKIEGEFLLDSDNPRKFYRFAKNFIRLGRGMDFKFVKRIAMRFRLMKGAGETLKSLKKRGYKIVIVSANDERIIMEFMKKHGIHGFIDHIYASKFGVRDGKLDGNIYGTVIRTEKVGVVKEIEKKYRVSRKDIIYVGDGLTDLPIMKKVGSGILFCPKEPALIEVLRNKALKRMKSEGRLFVVGKKDLREVLRFV